MAVLRRGMKKRAARGSATGFGQKLFLANRRDFRNMPHLVRQCSARFIIGPGNRVGTVHFLRPASDLKNRPRSGFIALLLSSAFLELPSDKDEES